MGEPTVGPVRVLRAALTAALVLCLAVLAHTSAGGAAPSPVAAVVLLLVLAPVTLWTTRVRLGTARAAALLICGQVLVHGALTSMAPAAHGSAATLAHHGQHGVLPGAAGTGGSPETLVAGMHPSATMLASHLLATLVTAWLLARGERLLWTVVARLVPAPRTPLRRLAAPTPLVRYVSAVPPVATWTPLASRGPPR